MTPLDPTTTAKLLALPSLREQAEAEALEYHKSWVLLSPVGGCSWDGIDEWNRDALIAASVALLADLTRWQSQAWALREIGRLLRWDVGNRVPELSCLNHGAGPELCWAVTRSPINVSGNNVAQFYDEWPYYAKPESRHKILGMSRITDRPAAIAAILLHLSESR